MRKFAGPLFFVLALFSLPSPILAQCGVERWSVKTGTDPDAGLVNLEGMKKLKNLYLWQTKVTDTGVTRLKKALPNVDINRGLDLKPVEVKKPETKKEETKKDDPKKPEEKKKQEPKKEDKKKDAPKKPEEKK